MAQLTGKGGILANHIDKSVNHWLYRWQFAIGRGVALAGQRKSVVAIVIGANQNDPLGLARSQRCSFPYLRIDSAAAWIINVRAEQANRC